MVRSTTWRWRNVPLPEAHLGAGLMAVGMEVLHPRPLTGRRLRPLGLTLAAAGLGLAAWATRAAEDVDLDHPDRLVVRGPYAFMPHPMYTGWTLMYIGAGLVARSAWTIRLSPVVVLLNRLEIVREERWLVARFGPAYAEYRSGDAVSSSSLSPGWMSL